MLKPICVYVLFADETNLQRHYIRHHRCGYHSRDEQYELEDHEFEARTAAIKRCQWGPRCRRRAKLKRQCQQKEAIETGRLHRPVGRSPPARPPGYGGRSGQGPARKRPDTKCQRRRPSLKLPANRRPPSPAAPAHWHAPAAAESSDSPRAPPVRLART